MKIVFLSPSGQMGGAEAALVDVIASLKEAEPDWELQLITAEAGPLTEKARLAGAATTVLPFPESLARLGDSSLSSTETPGRLNLLRHSVFATPAVSAYVSRLKRALRDCHPDVIHTNGFKMHLLGALAKPRAVPLVWHIHDYLQSRQFMAGLMKLARARCSAIVVNSDSVGRDVTMAIGNGLPLRTVHNGIDTRVFSPQGERLDLDGRSGLAPATPETIRVGLLATLARWKGHEVFLRALALIDREFPLRGYIIGDALYQTGGSQTSLGELKALAAQLGVADRVGFTGFVAEPATAIRALDVVVHASTQPEPFGLVIAEAMSCGRAVIMSEAGGASELVEGNVNALAHEPGNAAQLAQRIVELAGDAALRKRLGAAGRVTAVERFDRKRLAKELVPIYESVRGGSTEVRGQRSEVRDQKAVGSRQKAESRAASLGSFSTSDIQPPTRGPRPLIPDIQPPTRDLRPLISDSRPPTSGPRSLAVLHVHAGNMSGGVESMLLTQVQFQAKCPGLTSSFALCFEGRFSEALLRAGARVHSLGAVRVRQPRSVRLARKNLSELLQRESFDAVVVHSSWSQAIFGSTIRAAKVPLIFYMHGQANGKHWLERWARRTTPDFVVANSQFTVASLPNLYPDVPSAVVYCPVAPPENGLDHDTRSKLRAELNTPDDATVIIQVSRMETGKGHKLHFEALSLLRDLPGWICWLVGGAQNQNEQEYLAELKDAATRLGISDRVRFSGPRSDVHQLLRAADIFCQPNTSSDSFGIVFIEALYARLPVVTTEMGAVHEFIDESCGVLVPPANAHALADSLRKLITNSAERDRLGTAGPIRANQLCDPAAYLSHFEESIRNNTR